MDASGPPVDARIMRKSGRIGTFVRLVIGLAALVATAAGVGCSGGTTADADGNSSTTSAIHCRRGLNRCECSVSSQTIDDEWTEVPNCDETPSGAVACASMESGGEVDHCYYEMPYCGKVSYHDSVCECGFSNPDLARDPVSSCTGRVCCEFGDELQNLCSCTDLSDSNLTNTRYAKDCTVYGGRIVSSCSRSSTKGECPSAYKTVPSCKGLKWKAPKVSDGSSSSSGSTGCSGCTSDSQCGKCGRCELSTCSCRVRAGCQ